MPTASTIVHLKVTLHFLLSLLVGLVVMANGCAAEKPDTIDADDTKAEQSQAIGQHNLVMLDAAQQTQAGIQTQALKIVQHQAEFQATASVVDLQPLLSLREQYFSALAEHQGAVASLRFAKQTANRAETLYQNGVSSQRQLQSQQMQMQTDQARVNSSQYRLQSLNESLLSHWGATLSGWAKLPDNAAIRAFITAEQALLLLTLPANQSLPAKMMQIVIAPSGDRQKIQTAQLISKAPQGSEISQGETYFLQTSRNNLRTGMRVSAWIEIPGSAQNGVNIPGSAIIWHAGHANIFLKTAPEQFTRHTLDQYQPMTQGYFVADDLPANAEVVTTGAQLLLSQELKAIIPREDDGDD